MSQITRPGLLVRLIKEHVSKYSKSILWAVVCMAIAALATAAFPYFLKPAFDFVFSSNNMEDLIFFCSCIFGSFIIKGIASYFESFIMLMTGQKIIFDIQKRLFSHLLHADLSFFNDTSSGDLLSRFSNDVSLMRNAVSTSIIVIGRDLLTFVFLAAVMFYRDPTLAIFVFTIFPTAIIPIVLFGRKMKKVTQKTQSTIGNFSGYLTQIFQGIRIVKAYGNEHIESSRMRHKTDSILDLLAKSSKIKAILHPISECIAGVAIISVLAYGGSQVMSGGKTTGDLISFIGALLLSYEPLRRLTQLSANMNEGIAAAKRVFEIIDIKPEVINVKNPIKISSEIESIEFRDVEFSYKHGKRVLDKVSFSVKRGETIAFVGKSGAGKSTIINLIPRFYDTTSGEIFINETDIKNIDIEFLRNQIAIVTQENILFDASFYDNISYGKKDATMEEVITAAKLANADEFIMQTKNKYETIVGENGVLISGGQRQRISIARAMLKNSPILLLDEATSSLDTGSEKAVQKALEALMKNRTTIIVAHRLSSIVNADRIFVMDNGEIIEQGTHNELLKLNKVYAELWSIQEH